MRVIPVIDLKAGHAVHAVAGNRAHYQPVRSILHAGSDPLGLARAFRDTLGLCELYLADLDAIAGAGPDARLYSSLVALGLNLWVDAGLRGRASATPLLDSGVATVVAGLETVRGASGLAEIVDAAGPDAVVFSLDLDDGRPRVAPGAGWGTTDPRALAAAALAVGVHRLLLLDLARVGTGRGVGTVALLSDLTAAHPRVEIAVGGGVGGIHNLRALAVSGASAVLVGSALHDGRLGRAELASVSGI